MIDLGLSSAARAAFELRSSYSPVLVRFLTVPSQGLAAPQPSPGTAVKMGFRGNNVLHRNHFRKDWQRRVKTWFDQPGAKKRRRTARAQKAAKAGVRSASISISGGM